MAMHRKGAKVLQIGNYPPPLCGWAIQTVLVEEELRRRGQICKVLKINENREVKSPEYIDVQGGADYLYKVVRHALAGYRINVHVNGQSKKGYFLALAAMGVARLTFRPALLTFHGGLAQQYFPRHDSTRLHWAFKLLFLLSNAIACDSDEIKRAIIEYGVNPESVTSIATFSPQYVEFETAALSGEIEEFLRNHNPVFFSYVSFRPEYRLEVLREGMNRFRQAYSKAGFIWLGFPGKEYPLAEEQVSGWPEGERQSLLLLGNLSHQEFLTLMTRCTACLRTPACDGVSASVKEALALGIPVVASENGRRPAGVITYDEFDSEDMSARLTFVVENYDNIRRQIHVEAGEDNIALMADWLTGETAARSHSEAVGARTGD
jgi:glycosyltransferase involved in cell wall biosynthesis